MVVANTTYPLNLSLKPESSFRHGFPLLPWGTIRFPAVLPNCHHAGHLGTRPGGPITPMPTAHRAINQRADARPRRRSNNRGYSISSLTPFFEELRASFSSSSPPSGAAAGGVADLPAHLGCLLKGLGCSATLPNEPRSITSVIPGAEK